MCRSANIGCSLGIELELKDILVEKKKRERPSSWERLKAKEKSTADNEMVGWQASQFNGHQFEQTPEILKGREVTCCSPLWVLRS